MISKYINASGFGLILLCILLPFFSIKCNNMSLMTIQGYDLIFGKSLDPKNPFGGDKKSDLDESGNKDDENQDLDEEGIISDKEEIFDTENKSEVDNEDKGKGIKPLPFIIFLEVLALVGLIMAMRNVKTNWILVIVITQIVCLVISVAVINLQLKENMGDGGEAYGMILKLGFEIGFWLTTFTLLVLFIYNIYLKVTATNDGDEFVSVIPQTKEIPPPS